MTEPNSAPSASVGGSGSGNNSKKQQQLLLQQQQQRTIQVKIGNQAARAMTPDQAADYLKTIASKGWGAGRELKMTFDNGSTSTVSLPRTGGSGGGAAALMPGADITIDAAAAAADSIGTAVVSVGGGGGPGGTSATTTTTTTTTTSLLSSSTSTTTTTTMMTTTLMTTAAATAAAAAATPSMMGRFRSDGMPCSEKEMKALMVRGISCFGGLLLLLLFLLKFVDWQWCRLRFVFLEIGGADALIFLRFSTASPGDILLIAFDWNWLGSCNNKYVM
jgi:hypothetical protein